MKRMAIGLSLLVSFGLLRAESRPSAARKEKSPEALKAEIEALKPAKHIWREIAWTTCPLAALKASREQKKPVIVWVYLGIPTDERC